MAVASYHPVLEEGTIWRKNHPRRRPGEILEMGAGDSGDTITKEGEREAEIGQYGGRWFLCG